jgi:hypothetical protein
MSPLFDQVVALSGISELFAHHALARARERAGVQATRLSPLTLKSALPEIERTLRTFCPEEAEIVMSRLRTLTRSAA